MATRLRVYLQDVSVRTRPCQLTWCNLLLKNGQYRNPLRRVFMPEEGDLGEVQTSSDSTAGKWLLLAAALIYVAGSLFLLFNLRGRLDQLGKDQAARKTQLADLSRRIQVV